jgi:hypothetical protein
VVIDDGQTVVIPVRRTRRARGRNLAEHSDEQTIS